MSFDELPILHLNWLIKYEWISFLCQNVNNPESLLKYMSVGRYEKGTFVYQYSQDNTNYYLVYSGRQSISYYLKAHVLATSNRKFRIRC